MINLGSVNEEKGNIVPAKDGNGNIVFLKNVYYHSPDEENPSKSEDDKIIFIFEDKFGMEFKERMLNPVNAREEAQTNRGLSRLSHLLGAFMTVENYTKFVKTNYQTIGDLVEGAKTFMVEKWKETPARLLVVYNKQGYLTLPYGVVISTELKKKTLAFDSAKGRFFLTKPQHNESPDDEFAGGSGQDDDF